MNIRKNESGNIALAAVAVVVGLVVGFAVARVSDSGSTDSNKTSSSSMAAPSADTKAAGLRAMLTSIETEHVDLATAATRAGFDGDPSFDAAAAATLQNSKELSEAIGSVYGDEAGAKFKEIFDSHIKFFVDYTVAAKAGDKAGMDKAVQNLNGYVEAISTFLSGANPNLPKDAVAQLFTEHVSLLKGAVDAHAAGNNTESYAKQKEANDQIETIAAGLAGAIVKQKPESFKQ